jgi:hypothetical protein
MTRFETTVTLAIAALVGAAYSPAFGQYVRFDGGTKEVTAEVKGPEGKARPGRAPRAPSPPKPEEPVEPTFMASGHLAGTVEKARENAIQTAVENLREYLAKQDPPVERMPPNPTEFVRKRLIEKYEKTDTIQDRDDETGQTVTLYKVTVAVRVEPDQVRQLRSRERASDALWVLAGLAGLAAVGAVFFRIDAWTKGYLTSWLVLGTVGAATLLAGLWWWAK